MTSSPALPPTANKQSARATTPALDLGTPIAAIRDHLPSRGSYASTLASLVRVLVMPPATYNRPAGNGTFQARKPAVYVLHFGGKQAWYCKTRVMMHIYSLHSLYVYWNLAEGCKLFHHSSADPCCWPLCQPKHYATTEKPNASGS